MSDSNCQEHDLSFLEELDLQAPSSINQEEVNRLRREIELLKQTNAKTQAQQPRLMFLCFALGAILRHLLV